MLTPEIAAVLRQTITYLNQRYSMLPDGTITRLAATAPIREGATLLDTAAGTGDVAAMKQACRAWILAWRVACGGVGTLLP